MHFKTTLQAALKSENPLIFNQAVLVVSEFINKRYFEIQDMSDIEPMFASIRALGPVAEHEDEIQLKVRHISAVNVLSYLDEIQMKWNQEMTDLLIKTGGLPVIIEQIKRNEADSLVDQAC